jgi:hypothetical protein
MESSSGWDFQFVPNKRMALKVHTMMMMMTIMTEEESYS